ncbi:MAG TPA: helix-turn-helix transcriptional regulator [Acidothermaceae bacterium]|nr:helix-turn-helix transcriptional regulator [Acidothermaceae bacterium]
MVQRRRVVGPPREYLIGEWPGGHAAADAPLALRYAQHITRTITVAMADEGPTSVCQRADIARSTLHDILTGRSWPDLVTLAKLEDVFGTRLWP